MARTNIERARAELRLGEAAAGDELLRSTSKRLDDWTPVDADDRRRSAARDVLRGVAYSVRGQGFERQGRFDEAARMFERAVDLLSAVDDDEITPRDRSDFGVALAALRRDEEAVRHLVRARDEKGDTSEADRHLARIHLERNELVHAERLLHETLQVTPSDPDAHVLLGWVQARRGHPSASATSQHAALLLLDSGRPREACQLIEELRNITGRLDEARELHAEALRLDGQPARAVHEFENVLAERTTAWVLARYARALFALGRVTDAGEAAARALRLAPEDVSVLVLCGQLALETHDLVTASSYARQALDIDPREPTAYALQAAAEEAQGAHETAVEIVRAGRALAPQDPELLRQHARLERMIGDMRAALGLHRAVCALSTATPRDYWEFADLLAAAEQINRAVDIAAEGRSRWDGDLSLLELHGDLLRRSGRIEESVRVLREAARRGPASARAYVLLALSLRDRDPDDISADAEVFAALERSAELETQWPDPHWLRGKFLRARGDFSGATEALTTALRLDPLHPGALAELGELRLEEGNLDEALALTDRLQTVLPGDTAARVLSARVQLAQRRPSRALNALSPHPSVDHATLDEHYTWHLLRAEAQFDLRHWDAAAADLNAAIKLRPDAVEAYQARAEVSQMRGDAAQALEDAGTALLQRPELVKAWITQGSALATLGRRGEARVSLEEALRLDPENIIALQQLAQVLAPENPGEARRLLDRALLLAPTNRELRLEEAWLDLTDGRAETALERFELLAQMQLDAESLSGQAEALRLLGRPFEAADAAERALTLVPDDPQALRSLGYALLAAGDNESAVEAFAHAHHLYPDDARAKVDLATGYASSAIDKLEQAVELLQHACLLSPADPWVLAQMAQSLLGIGSYADAAQFYERALVADPGDVVSWYGLGRAYQYQEPAQLSRAAEMFERARLLAPDDYWVQKSIANVLHLQGDSLHATEHYSRILAETEGLRSEFPDLLEVVGWCAFRLGDFTTAASAFLEVLSTTTEATGGDFDLALVLYCDPESRHGVDSYRRAVEALQRRDVHARRGVLRVALTDYRQALTDHSELRALKNSGVIEHMLADALGALPPPPSVTVDLDSATTAGPALAPAWKTARARALSAARRVSTL